jgi:hypothetical protein
LIHFIIFSEGSKQKDFPFEDEGEMEKPLTLAWGDLNSGYFAGTLL